MGNPCCTRTLQNGVKIIAIFQLFLAGLLIASGVAGLILDDNEGSVIKQTDLNTKATAATDNKKDMLSTISELAGGIFTLITAIVLLNGANRRNRTACLVWFILNAFSLVFSLHSTFTVYQYEEPAFFGARIVGLCILSYFLWVVCAFMKELYQEEQALGLEPIRTVNIKESNLNPIIKV